jgi:hypothetical protein
MPHAPLPKIADVEALLMTVGLRAVISRQVETVTKAKLKTMSAIPKQVADLARKLVNDELSPSFYSDLNYRQAVKELAAGFKIEQVVAMTQKFPREYQVAGSALIIKAQEVVQQLSQLVPVSQYQTLAGSVDLLPADTKLFKFISILEVLDDPLMVFSLMGRGALLKTQANAVRVCYPTLSAAIDAAILQATMTAKSAKKSFELPYRAEYGIKAWFGKGPVPTSTLQKAQAAVARSNAKKAPAPTPPTPNAPPQPSLMSGTQKVEATA